MSTIQLQKRLRGLLVGGVVAAMTLAMGMSSAFGQEEGETPQIEPPTQQTEAQESMQERMQEMQGMQGLRGEIHRVILHQSANAYTNFVEDQQRDDLWKEDVEQYTMRGLNHLAFTLNQFVPERDTELKQRYQTLNEQILQLGQMSAEEREPSQSHQVFTNVNDYFQNVQQRYYPQYSQASEELSEKIDGLSEEEAIEEQGDAINDYFVTSAMSIEKMAFAPTEVGVGGGPVEDQPEMDHQEMEGEPGMEQDPEFEGPEIEEEPELEGPDVEQEPEIEGPEIEDEPQEDEPTEEL
jgi:hypothetical protein